MVFCVGGGWVWSAEEVGVVDELGLHSGLMILN